MSITKMTRQELINALRLKSSTSSVRVAISRGALVVDENGLISLKDAKNRRWIEKQKKNQIKKGLIVNIEFDSDEEFGNNAETDIKDEKELQETKGNITASNIDFEYKKAQLQLTEEKIQTEALNRNIKLGSYIKADDIKNTLNTYFAQFLNNANINLNNVTSTVCRDNGITSTETILALKSMQADALNASVKQGLKEMMRALERSVEEQQEKFIK